MTQHAQWDSTLSFLFAMIGIAVGLGNIWRFSYVVYTNGGGAFFIPYLVSIFILAIPFLLLEYGIGFSFKTSYTEIVKKVNPKLEIVAWVLVLFIFVVTIYYMVIIGWDLLYLLSSLKFNWGTDITTFFTNNIGGSSNFANAGSFIIPTVIAVLISWYILWFISSRDVDKGIGKASKILIPLLFFIMAIIIVYALTLPGASIGINTLIHPKWETLWDVNIWLAAFGQIIFSLSAGESLAMTYASYLPENSKLIDNALVVIASNSLFEICTAFGIFSILGFMSYSSGTPITDLISEGTSLMFIVFPTIFNYMGYMSHILAPLLFLAILFAGITSALGLLEPTISSIYMKFGWSRKKTVTVVCVIGCIFSLMLTTGISSYLIGIIDSYVNKFGILFIVPIQAIIFGWIYGVDKIIPVLNENSTFKIGKLWSFNIKYAAPIILFVLWFFGIIGLFSNATGFEIMVNLVVTGMVLVSAILLSRKKSVRE